MQSSSDAQSPSGESTVSGNREDKIEEERKNLESAKAEIESKRAEIENQTGKQPNLSIDSLPLAGTDGVSNLNQTKSDQTEMNLSEEGTNQTSTLSTAIIIRPRNDEIEGRKVEERQPGQKEEAYKRDEIAMGRWP